MKISRKISAAAVAGLMAAVSTAGYLTYAEESNAPNALQGGITIAADTVETKIYDAEAQLTVGEATAKAGDKVSVPVYLTIPENDFLTAVAFKAIYDKSALELESITEPSSPALSEGKLDVSEESGIFCYTWSTKDITVDKSKPVCYYNFKVKSTASGEYPIKLVNHLVSDNSKPIEIVHTQEAHRKNTYYDPSVTYGSIKVMSDEASVSKTYEGTAYIIVDKDIDAAPGETVDVPVYMELGKDVVDGKYISGVGFKVSYSSDLTLDAIVCPNDCGLDGGEENINLSKGIFCYSTSNKDITVDPSKPICILKFTPSFGADGRYVINLVNHLTGDTSMPVEVVHRTGAFPSTFLKPVVSAGWINVEEDEEGTTKPAKNDTTSPTKEPSTTATKDDKPTDPIDYDLLYWGDVNLDEYVDLADVTTLSKYLLSKKSYPLINSTAWENADCKYDQKIDSSDLSKLIEFNLRKITMDDLGPTDPALRRRSKRYQ